MTKRLEGMSSNNTSENNAAKESSQLAPESKSKSRRSFILMLIAFALPVILAKLALENNWLAYGVTNQGQLIEGELTLEKLGLNTANFDEQWLILYAMPENCDSHCEQTLESVHNSYVALGSAMPRVTPIALSQVLSSQQLTRISDSEWQLIPMPALAKNRMDHPQILVADPQGNVFLSHSIPENNAELSAFGKQILADMKKLLKYSRIG
jgi:hypothetical protein|tara:strand:- start:41 stop:670 length:630 start_codon:yes stop_codon:yes gene_type:complete